MRWWSDHHIVWVRNRLSWSGPLVQGAWTADGKVSHLVVPNILFPHLRDIVCGNQDLSWAVTYVLAPARGQMMCPLGFRKMGSTLPNPGAREGGPVQSGLMRPRGFFQYILRTP